MGKIKYGKKRSYGNTFWERRLSPLGWWKGECEVCGRPDTYCTHEWLDYGVTTCWRCHTNHPYALIELIILLVVMLAVVVVAVIVHPK